MNHLEAAILLNMMPDLGPVRIKNLMDRFKGLDNVFEASTKSLSAVEGISISLARELLKISEEEPDQARRELDLADKHGIGILTLDDPVYPSILSQIQDPPPVLYYKGDVQILRNASVAVVGTRRPTPYGVRMAGVISGNVARYGLPVISGLARGIDTCVHKSVLDAQGATAAVLGSGLLNVYPPENRRLAERVAGEGLMVSEFPLHACADREHFPRRNRVIAGLSLGTVVVEAAERSGALITARFAAEQGKEVFAVPGPVTSQMSLGPNRLIRQGAKLVEKAEDVLEEICPMWDRARFLGRGVPPGRRFQELTSLSDQERDILELVGPDPSHIDSLYKSSRISDGDLSRALLLLELRGAVKSLPGKMYARV